MDHYDIVIIGGGLAGLTAAKTLEEHNINYILLEKNSTIGGKQRTDTLDGFQCDHGFQVLSTAYPEAKKTLDLDTLRLKPFSRDAYCYNGSGFTRIAHPFENIITNITAIHRKLLTPKDLFIFSKLAFSLLKKSTSEILESTEKSTLDYWKTLGFSSSCIYYFLSPFFKGIFLDNTLTTSSRLWLYYFKQFLIGKACIPEQGIQAIPEQIASHCSPNSIKTGHEVLSIEKNTLHIKNADSIKSKLIICATSNPAASTLFHFKKIPYQSVSCFYFETSEPLIKHKGLHLDGSKGLINNFHSVTHVNPIASPKNKYLLSFSAIPEYPERIIHENEIKKDAQRYFGNQTETWNFVNKYLIKEAVPVQQHVYSSIRTNLNTDHILMSGD
ncbi:hypothetical protein DID78_00385, partial [Candidatus Marinamargulisbacteria bacterium SCGC AG-343-D04]